MRVPGNSVDADFVDLIYGAIGGFVRDARTEAARTQEDLASALSLTRSSIANLEAGRQRVPIHIVILIARELSVPVSRLIPESLLDLDSQGASQVALENLEGADSSDQDFVLQALRPIFGAGGDPDGS